MGCCSFVEKRRNRYYFRARLPADIGRAVGRTHVVASLGTADPRGAKTNSAKLFFLLARFFETMRLRMTHPINIDGNSQNPADVLALGAFELGRQFQMSVEQLRQEFHLRLKELVIAVQAPAAGDTRQWEFPAVPLGMGQTEHPRCELPARPMNGPGAGRPVILDQASENSAVAGNIILSSPVWHTLRDEFLRDKPALGPKAKTHGKASEVSSAPSHQQNAPIISKTPGMHQFENIRLDHPDPAAGQGAARR